MIPKTILIAHQDIKIRELFKKDLSFHFSLIIFNKLNDISLLSETSQKHPHLLFLECDSVLSLDIIKNSCFRFPKSKIILLSEPQNESLTLQGIHHGANGYLLSPFHSEEIINLSR